MTPTRKQLHAIRAARAKALRSLRDRMLAMVPLASDLDPADRETSEARLRAVGQINRMIEQVWA